MYIGRFYEQLIAVRDRYKKQTVPLPIPEFYTFYNGKEKWDKEKEIAFVRRLYSEKFNTYVRLKGEND